MKRLTVLSALISGFLLVGANGALALTTLNTHNSFKDLAAGTYTVNDDLLITSTGSITCNDNATDQPGAGSGTSACPITIVVTGNMLMEAGSLIQAENQSGGGNGGNIAITVGGNMTMCGAAGAQAGCGAASGNPGALISSQKIAGAGDTGVGGDITVTVGNAVKASGAFYMEGGTKGYGTETGARIISDGTGPAGDITINAYDTYFTEPGAVVEAGGPFLGQSAVGQGGKIFLVSSCGLTTQGRVTSKGPDPGADLIHIESCNVLIQGLVESTGKGHTVDAHPDAINRAPFNSCDNFADGLNNEVVHVDKPSNATGCIEVWGKIITIDSTNGWAGELNADIGNGGAAGMGWIDLYAYSKLTVTDGTGNDRSSNNLGHTYFSVYAVHANSIDGSDGSPGIVTAKVKNGTLTASGKAFEASATLNDATGHGTTDEFVGNGSDGGTIILEASGAVTLDNSWINASGDFAGTLPLGGHIVVHAWGAGSNISWKTVNGDVQPNATGDITLAACGPTVDTTGTNFNGEAPNSSTGGANCDAAKPELPSYVAFNQAAWTLCGTSTISGHKFDAANGAPLANWTIHLTNVTGPAVDKTTTTNAQGEYSFSVDAGATYQVCEVLLASWTEAFPVSGPSCAAGEGHFGYTVDLTGFCCVGTDVTGKDFYNRRPSPPPPPPFPPCVEDPARTNLMTRIVDPTKTGGGGVPKNPAFYQTVQAAYNAARDSQVAQSEVIGLFANTTENLVLDGSKAITITQCTVAKVTASLATLPVWDITATGKLTIIGPDSVGGTVGWKVGGNGYHTLKSIRANGAKYQGVLITSDNNSLSFNDVSGNGSGGATDAGIRVTGNKNTLKSGTIGPNNGDGIQLVGNSNNVSGMNSIAGNTGNGVLVSGSTNTVSGNGRINQNSKNGIQVTGSTNTISSNASESGKGNTLNGIYVSAGSGNSLSDNKMQSNGQAGFNLANSTSTNVKNNANSNNGGNEFTIGTNNNVNSAGNKKNGTSFTFGAAGGNFN
jgi:parallel beta-helix repeat protein